MSVCLGQIEIYCFIEVLDFGLQRLHIGVLFCKCEGGYV